MSRTIQFRARSLLTGEWVYGDYMTRWRGRLAGPEHHIVAHPNGRDAGREILHSVDIKTLGQWTGRKDLFGEDIYEGDVVSFIDNSSPAAEQLSRMHFETFTVEWSTERSGFWPVSVNEWEPHDWWELWTVRVLGNIHPAPVKEEAA